MSTSTPSDDAPWNSFRFAVVDLEGNGQQPPDLVELSVIPIDLGTPGIVRSWLVKPSQEITRRVTRIHGIRNADVEMAPTFDTISAEILESLAGRCLVAHNAAVDWGVLQRKLPSLKPPAVIDTLRLTRALYPGRISYSLDSLIVDLGLQKHLEGVESRRHRATYDATAALHLLLYVIAKAPGGTLSFRQLIALSALPGVETSRQQNLF